MCVRAGAGLGGGSGNAATTLWAANELTGRPASNEQLLEWSGAIGSDISVFFSNGAAYCTGRGEIVEDVAPPLPLSTEMLLVSRARRKGADSPSRRYEGRPTQLSLPHPLLVVSGQAPGGPRHPQDLQEPRPQPPQHRRPAPAAQEHVHLSKHDAGPRRQRPGAARIRQVRERRTRHLHGCVCTQPRRAPRRVSLTGRPSPSFLTCLTPSLPAACRSSCSSRRSCGPSRAASSAPSS
jgi:hypothetical protein